MFGPYTIIANKDERLRQWALIINPIVPKCRFKSVGAKERKAERHTQKKERHTEKERQTEKERLDR